MQGRTFSVKRAAVSVAVAVLFLGMTTVAHAALVGPEPPGLPPVPEPASSLLFAAPSSSGSSSSSAQAQSSAAEPQALSATEVHGAFDLERSITARINAVRRSYRLRALTLSPALTRAARAHAGVLALGGFFAHEWSDGTSFANWIRRFYPAGNAHVWSVAENLEWATSLDARQAVDLWLASPEHRRNLLGRQWRQIGLGVVSVSNAPGVYAGQDVLIAASEFGVRG